MEILALTFLLNISLAILKIIIYRTRTPLIFDPNLLPCVPVTGLCIHWLLKGWSLLLYFSTMNAGDGWLHEDNSDFPFKGHLCVSLVFRSTWTPALHSQLRLFCLPGPSLIHFATCHRRSSRPLTLRLHRVMCWGQVLSRAAACVGTVRAIQSLRPVTDSPANSKASSAFKADVSSDADQSDSLRHDVLRQLLLRWFGKDFTSLCRFWKFAFVILAAFVFKDLSAKNVPTLLRLRIGWSKADDVPVLEGTVRSPTFQTERRLHGFSQTYAKVGSLSSVGYWCTQMAYGRSLV